MKYKIVAQNIYSLFDLLKDIKNNPSQAPALAVKAIEANPSILKTIIAQAIMQAPLYLKEIVTKTIENFPDRYIEIISAASILANTLDKYFEKIFDDLPVNTVYSISRIMICDAAQKALNSQNYLYTLSDIFDAMNYNNAPENDPIRELFNPPQ